MRGLFLAVFALLIVAGDSGRYVPQLIANASKVLAPASLVSDSDPTEKASSASVNAADGMEQDSTESSPDAQTSDNIERFNYSDYHLKHDALALLWLAAKQGSENAQARLLGEFERAYNAGFIATDYIDETTAIYF